MYPKPAISIQCADSFKLLYIENLNLIFQDEDTISLESATYTNSSVGARNSNRSRSSSSDSSSLYLIKSSSSSASSLSYLVKENKTSGVLIKSKAAKKGVSTASNKEYSMSDDDYRCLDSAVTSLSTHSESEYRETEHYLMAARMDDMTDDLSSETTEEQEGELGSGLLDSIPPPPPLAADEPRAQAMFRTMSSGSSREGGNIVHRKCFGGPPIAPVAAPEEEEEEMYFDLIMDSPEMSFEAYIPPSVEAVAEYDPAPNSPVVSLEGADVYMDIKYMNAGCGGGGGGRGGGGGLVGRGGGGGGGGGGGASLAYTKIKEEKDPGPQMKSKQKVFYHKMLFQNGLNQIGCK